MTVQHVEIIGVYPVDAPEPCHLVEVIFTGFHGPIDVGKFTQPTDGQPKDNWQVPWDERVLDATGTRQISDPFSRAVQADGDVRLTFFFHYLQFDRPMITPAGEIELPQPAARPARLAFLKYDPPD